MKNQQGTPYLTYPETCHGTSSHKLFPFSQLPEWLDATIDQRWTPENSLAIDRWLAYIAVEFEGVQP